MSASSPRRASRYVRPASPPPIVLQRRDRAILTSVYRHRYLTAEHIDWLHFAGRSMRPVQERLRKLWANGYLERRFLPFTLVPAGQGGHRTSRPLYALAKKGAVVVANDLDLDAEAVPHTPHQNAAGFATIHHHLVVTDLLVALVAAARAHPELEVASFEREHALRQKLATMPKRSQALVPDGVVRLRHVPTGTCHTFYVEVVRAGVRSGNDTIERKLRKYVQLHRKRAFAALYGHDDLRAVLFATTSQSRAENLQQRAAGLRHGRRFFWFGCYPRTWTAGVPETTFTPTTVLGVVWQDGDGGSHTLAPKRATHSPVPSMDPPGHRRSR